MSDNKNSQFKDFILKVDEFFKEEEVEEVEEREIIKKINNPYIGYKDSSETIFYMEGEIQKTVKLEEILLLNLRPRDEEVNEVGLINKDWNVFLKIILLPFTSIYQILQSSKNFLIILIPIFFLLYGLETHKYNLRSISFVIFIRIIVLKDWFKVPYLSDTRTIERRDIYVLKKQDKDKSSEELTFQDGEKMIEIYHFDENCGDKKEEIEDIYYFIQNKMKEKGYIQ